INVCRSRILSELFAMIVERLALLRKKWGLLLLPRRCSERCPVASDLTPGSAHQTHARPRSVRMETRWRNHGDETQKKRQTLYFCGRVHDRMNLLRLPAAPGNELRTCLRRDFQRNTRLIEGRGHFFCQHCQQRRRREVESPMLTRWLIRETGPTRRSFFRCLV